MCGVRTPRLGTEVADARARTAPMLLLLLALLMLLIAAPPRGTFRFQNLEGSRFCINRYASMAVLRSHQESLAGMIVTARSNAVVLGVHEALL